MGETHSVRELCEIAFGYVGLDFNDYVIQDERFYRPAEVDMLVSDPSRARAILGWEPSVTFKDLVTMMVDSDMKRLDDFRLRMGRHELVPIVTGGMGVDISSSDLALVAARLGGVGHISDAMVNTVTDRRYKTKYVKAKQALYKYNVQSDDKSAVKFDMGHLAEATRLFG